MPFAFEAMLDRASPWARGVLALGPALGAAVAIYAPTLGLFFAQDDVTFLLRAAGTDPTPWSFARPLSEGVAWRAMYAAFGLNPTPYHAVLLSLHLIATALVYFAARRLFGGRVAAGCAAVLFGASSVGFTALHWSSCIVEVLATTLALASFTLWLEARAYGSRALLWISAVVMVGAMLSKESTVVLPVVLLMAAWRDGAGRAAGKLCAPHAALAALLVAAFFASRPLFGYGQYVGGGYTMSFAPGFLLANLGTYLSWSVSLLDPIRDLSAMAHPGAGPLGLLMIAVVTTGVLQGWRRERDPLALGMLWFALFLLPVLPLAHHSYLYYMYLPWAGAAWAIVAALRAMCDRVSRPVLIVASTAALAAFIGVQAHGVRVRESASQLGVPTDKTVRESMLLRNAITGLRTARLAPGTRVGFVNPFPREHHAAGGPGSTGAATTGAIRSYIPLEGALRGGESLRLFVPGLVYAGFAVLPPQGWEDVEMFLFDNDGTLSALGRGARAFVKLGKLMLDLERPAEAEAMLSRAKLLGAATADSDYLMMIAIGGQGRIDEGQRAARAFLARWPLDPRAGRIRAQILQGDAAVPALGR